MKSSSQHKSFCSVLHSAVLDLCREKYYTETIDWEVDGILCISLPDSKEQHVVKIHEKFPLDRTHNLPFDDGRCFACEKQCDVEEERERRDNDYQHNSEEEERYRDVSVIDLEHGIQPHNMVRTSPRGQQMEHISGRGEDLESENQTAFFSQSKRQENSNSTISSVPRIEKVISVKESFSNIPNEPLPPPPVDIGDEADYTVIKTEPDESEDFGLHMQCVNEEYNPNKTSDVRDEAQQMQTEVKTEEVAFLLGSNVHSATSQNFDSSNTSSQAWGTRKHSLPSSTATISSINQPYPTASSSYDHSVKVSGNTMTLVKTPKMAAQNNVNNTSLSVPSTAAGNQSSTQQFKPLGVKPRATKWKRTKKHHLPDMRDRNKYLSQKEQEQQRILESIEEKRVRERELQRQKYTKVAETFEERAARNREMTRLRVQRYRQRKKFLNLCATSELG